MSVGEKVEGVWRGWAQYAKTRLSKSPVEEIAGDVFLERARKAASGDESPAAARAAAAALGEEMRRASPEGLSLRLAALSVGMAPDRAGLRSMMETIDLKNADAIELEAAIKGALKSPRRALLRLWLSLDGGLAFLVWLREKALADLKMGPEAKALEAELTDCLSEVFAQGLLKMKAVDWNSPAILLEKIMAYEAKRQFGSWGDFKSRLDQDRRIYAVFHSGWAQEPLCFLEVALTRGLVRKVGDIAKMKEPIEARLADTAMFYSISSPHAGLKGISFGEDLIRKAVEDLKLTAPGIKRFCALSPITGFSKWVEGLSGEAFKALTPAGLMSAKDGEPAWGRSELIEAGKRIGSQRAPERVKEAMLRLCAKYLAGLPGESRLRDPVARFHLGNGASIESLCFAADLGERAVERSYGMMALYLYDIDDLERNRLRHGAGASPASWRVRIQAR